MQKVIAVKKTYASEAEFLRDYNIHDYDIPLVSVDLAIFTLHEERLKLLLVKRGDYPQKGKWALPGGFVDVKKDRDMDATALRKLQEKTGVQSPYVEQLESVGSATRDPRGWSVTVVYFALIPYTAANAAAAVEEAAWVEVDEALARKLAFDHASLLERALQRLRSKVLYTLVPAHLIATPFTLSALQQAYEIILGREVEKKAFRRRLETAGVIEPTGGMDSSSPGRPAALYRLTAEAGGFNFSRQLSAE